MNDKNSETTKTRGRRRRTIRLDELLTNAETEPLKGSAPTRVFGALDEQYKDEAEDK